MDEKRFRFAWKAALRREILRGRCRRRTSSPSSAGSKRATAETSKRSWLSLTPKCEWHAALPMVGGVTVYRGHEGDSPSVLADVGDVLAEIRVRVPRDSGPWRPDRRGRHAFRARGKGSGVEVRDARCLRDRRQEAQSDPGSNTISIPRKPSKPPGCGSRAMSQENVETYRRVGEAFNLGATRRRRNCSTRR